jgi:hypothetical protein
MRRDPKRNTKLLSPLLTRKGDTKWMAPRTCCSLPHHAIVRAGARWVGILPVLSPNIDGRSFSSSTREQSATPDYPDDEACARVRLDLPNARYAGAVPVPGDRRGGRAKMRDRINTDTDGVSPSASRSSKSSPSPSSWFGYILRITTESLEFLFSSRTRVEQRTCSARYQWFPSSSYTWD